MMLMITFVALTVVIVLCLAALFHSAFEDNWLQHIGLIGVGVASALKLEQFHSRGFVSNESAMLCIALAMYALGTYWKARGWWRRDNPPRDRTHHHNYGKQNK